jgi:hypothetical protein
VTTTGRGQGHQLQWVDSLAISISCQFKGLLHLPLISGMELRSLYRYSKLSTDQAYFLGFALEGILWGMLIRSSVITVDSGLSRNPSRMPCRNFYSGPHIPCEESKTWKHQHIFIRIHGHSLHVLHRALFDHVCSRVQRLGPGERVRIPFECPC